VFGATGFVGKYVVHELAKHGTQVVCAYRSLEEKTMALRQMGDLGQIALVKDWSLHNDDLTEYAISRSNIVINLVGSYMETRNFTFDDIHHKWPAKLAKICAKSPLLERFVHFSDMGANANSASRRMRSKAAGDEAVRDILPGATILRPSIVIGDEDSFYNNILYQLKFGASMWLIDGGDQPLQPTYVTDVSAAVGQALQTEDSVGKTYHLGGPEILTMRQVVKNMYSVLHELEDISMTVPSSLAKLYFGPWDLIKKRLPPLPSRNHMHTVDWIDELNEGKVIPAGGLTYADLDMVPIKVTEGLPMEPVRFARHGGYGLGSTKALAKALPDKVKQFYGMDRNL